MQTQNAPAVRNQGKGALIAKFADKFGVDQDKLFGILKATCFKQPGGKGGQPAPDVTNEQMAALLVVADQYNLNPFTREIYAFPDKAKGIVPIVGVDGWARIMNEHPAMDGFEFRMSPESVKMDDDSKTCPEWVEAVIYRKDRSHPIVVREYLDECYRPAFKGKGDRGEYTVAGPWQSHPKRFLRHKALIQGARIAFGFAGVYDEDEGERIAQARVIDMSQGMGAAMDVAALPDTSAFDRLAEDMLSDAQFMQFVTETARASNCTVDALKVEAAKHWDGFVAAFQGWAKKSLEQATTTLDMPSQQETAKAAKPKSQPKEQAQAAQETYPCPERLDSDGNKVPVLTHVCVSCDSRPVCRPELSA